MRAGGGPGRISSWPQRLRLRLLLFAFGDFAFNLYWQSVTLFLLFYYTDAVGLPITVAATIFLVASIWDGIANFIAGIIVDRRHATVGRRGYAGVLTLGSIPLGLSFVLTYIPPLAAGYWGVAGVFTAHMLFRTAYAAVNVPYLAMTARIATDTRDRQFVAGTRMLFGTLAALLVALGTVPIGEWLLGNAHAARAYLGAAAVFAAAGTLILILVGSSYRESAIPPAKQAASVPAALRSLAANRAFVTLNLAMMATIVAMTVLNKSVLYYFRYFLHDLSAGQLALASMSLVSAIGVPLWMLLARPIGLRTLWFVATGLAMVGLAFFALFDIQRAGVMQLFLIGMQTILLGLHFVFWAMLPNTIEFGQKETGLRVEGTVFGLAALLQRIAVGIAVALLGWSFSNAGYAPNVEQSPETLSAIRWTIALVPLGFLALSCVLMMLNPLGKGVHARILRDLGSARD